MTSLFGSGMTRPDSSTLVGGSAEPLEYDDTNEICADAV